MKNPLRKATQDVEILEDPLICFRAPHAVRPHKIASISSAKPSLFGVCDVQVPLIALNSYCKHPLIQAIPSIDPFLELRSDPDSQLDHWVSVRISIFDTNVDERWDHVGS